MRKATRLLFITVALFLVGCATTLKPPKNKENVCAIFNEYPKWYRVAKKTEMKWGVPVYVQMAIIYYESAFKGDARPPRHYFLGIFPGKHLSSAYGYAQALDQTWKDYLTSAGSFFASRNKFDSATDFIGWYSVQARDRLGILQSDSYNLYLAYHEGLGGYEKKSYLKKPWLMRYAKNVALKSQIFRSQLACYENNFNILDLKKFENEPAPPSPIDQCRNSRSITQELPEGLTLEPPVGNYVIEHKEIKEESQAIPDEGSPI